MERAALPGLLSLNDDLLQHISQLALPPTDVWDKDICTVDPTGFPLKTGLLNACKVDPRRLGLARQ